MFRTIARVNANDRLRELEKVREHRREAERMRRQEEIVIKREKERLRLRERELARRTEADCTQRRNVEKCKKKFVIFIVNAIIKFIDFDFYLSK